MDDRYGTDRLIIRQNYAISVINDTPGCLDGALSLLHSKSFLAEFL